MTNYLRALHYLYSMKKRAYWNSKKLLEFQNRQLRRIIRYAYENSSFYNRRFRQTGVSPDEIKTAKDLVKLPLVRKEDMAQNVREIVSRRFEVDRLKAMRTSGSTGRPLYIYMTQAENEFRKAKHLRANMACGQRARDRWVTITSPLHFAETTYLQKLLRFYAATPVSVFDDIGQQIAKIAKLKPDIIDGYSNSILLLAREVKRQGISTISPRFLISGAELIDPGSRKFIEQVFDAPLYDQYACVEFERIAWQCQEKDGYHIDADSLIVQFVDAHGEEVAPGEEGEIVCTSLSNFAMPFIRYGLDDLGLSSEKSECACGRTFPLMKLVEGRKTSLLMFPSGRVLAPFALMLAIWTFKFYDFIEVFRVIQKRKDLLVFKMKIKDSLADKKVFENELKKHLRKELGLPIGEINFEVDFVENIPMDKSGKFRIVTSELN